MSNPPTPDYDAEANKASQPRAATQTSPSPSGDALFISSTVSGVSYTPLHTRTHARARARAPKGVKRGGGNTTVG